MNTTADVVIIGGGCMGTSVAYHLARRGVTDVVVIERESVLGVGSTGRNAGGVRHQFSSEANIKLSIESIRLFEQFDEVVGNEIDFHQDGYLFLLSSQQSVSAFRRDIDLQRRLGVAVEWLAPEEAVRLAPGVNPEGVLAATFCARDGIADPNGVTMGFANAARAAGVRIWRDTEVTGIEIASGRVSEVHTSRGGIGTRVVVNAAGPWAAQLGAMAGLKIPVLPYRRHIFIARPSEADQWTKGNRGEVPRTHIMVIDFDTSFYFHREGANVLFGMSDPDEPPTFETSVSWDFLEKVTPIAVRRLPSLEDAAVSHAWAGLYEVTPDAMPIIGPVPDPEGFFMVNGFSGHGFQHSPAAGRLLADMITGVDPGMDTGPFAFDRFGRGDLVREVSVV